MNPFTSALFRTPRWSCFDDKFSNKLSYRMGDLIPVKSVYLGPGDRYVADFGQLTRFNPLIAPVMDQYDLYVDSFFVAARVLEVNKNDEWVKFWNPALNGAEADNPNGIVLPKWDYRDLLSAAMDQASQDSRSLGSTLYDYLNYPTFRNLFTKLREAFSTQFAYGGVSSSGGVSFLSFFELPNTPGALGALRNIYQGNAITWSTLPTIVGDSVSVFGSQLVPALDDVNVAFPRVWRYSLGAYVFSVLNISPYDIQNIMGVSSNTVVVDWPKVFNSYGIDANTMLEGYYSWFFNMLFDDDKLFVDPNEPEETCSLLGYFPEAAVEGDWDLNDMRVRAYWRIVCDWYSNLNVLGKDNQTLFLETIQGMSSTAGAWENLWTPFRRNWANDYFTSAFPNPQAGSAVSVPKDGTMLDLRASNVWQWVKEKVLYFGKRSIDQWRGVFGVKSSNARYDMSEPLKREVFDIAINSVTQTNQSDIDNQLKTPLGSWSGQGISAGSRHFIDYTAEEPGLLMVLISVRPRQSYFQGLDKFLTKGSSLYDDFVDPNFANLGEQPIYSHELFFDDSMTGNGSVASSNTVFGYTRRYAEWMGHSLSEVHGDFRTTLDYWHSAREFDTRPTLGSDFLSVDPDRDNLNRVFATSGPQQLYSYIYIDGKVVRPLPKYVTYGL